MKKFQNCQSPHQDWAPSNKTGCTVYHFQPPTFSLISICYLPTLVYPCMNLRALLDIMIFINDTRRVLPLPWVLSMRSLRAKARPECRRGSLRSTVLTSLMEREKRDRALEWKYYVGLRPPPYPETILRLATRDAQSPFMVSACCLVSRE